MGKENEFLAMKKISLNYCQFRIKGLGKSVEENEKYEIENYFRTLVKERKPG